MGKIVAIDYGAKRCGIAITDELKIIASPLTTVAGNTILEFLETLVRKENVERFVLGDARRTDGSASETTLMIDSFGKKLEKKFPHIPISRVSEMYSSKLASKALVEGGMKKSKRQEKGNLDMVSAAIILQDYLQFGDR
jgi:putative Holliday junction resolvase